MNPSSRRGPKGAYSVIADEQLNRLEASDPLLYNDLVTICEEIFLHPDRAQSQSAAVRTADGIVLRYAVPGRYPYKVFWRRSDPRIEAVFPYP